jgi:hypothetical protein
MQLSYRTVVAQSFRDVTRAGLAGLIEELLLFIPKTFEMAKP